MFIFFFNDTATTEIYTLSLHDALPIFFSGARDSVVGWLVVALLLAFVVVVVVRFVRTVARDPDVAGGVVTGGRRRTAGDRESTRLNSSHPHISYAVFCFKKKKKQKYIY